MKTGKSKRMITEASNRMNAVLVIVALQATLSCSGISSTTLAKKVFSIQTRLRADSVHKCYCQECVISPILTSGFSYSSINLCTYDRWERDDEIYPDNMILPGFDILDTIINSKGYHLDLSIVPVSKDEQCKAICGNGPMKAEAMRELKDRFLKGQWASFCLHNNPNYRAYIKIREEFDCKDDTSLSVEEVTKALLIFTCGTKINY